MDHEGMMMLNRINVPRQHRGNGHARDLLNQILTDADKEGVTLCLHISPSDGLDGKQLSEWYKRHGFINTGGLYKRTPKSHV